MLSRTSGRTLQVAQVTRLGEAALAGVRAAGGPFRRHESLLSVRVPQSPTLDHSPTCKLMFAAPFHTSAMITPSSHSQARTNPFASHPKRAGRRSFRFGSRVKTYEYSVATVGGGRERKKRERKIEELQHTLEIA